MGVESRHFPRKLCPLPLLPASLSPLLLFSQLTPPPLLSLPFPSVTQDIVETDQAYEIYVDAPGMSPEEISCHYDEESKVLTVKGEHKEVRKETQKGVSRSERVQRSFLRSFIVPEGANPDEINAKLDKGVLSVTIPKVVKPVKAPRKIAVMGPSSPAAAEPAKINTTSS
jgi:HSP20 family protein